mmetsp:Transcript_12648/g.32516  ORF Transcript_12648/g.32516 Transcript_12648/m.32516 type:complete len:255 (-) Transcript_12648:100-864(-)
MWSVKMNTSASSLLRTPRAPSTSRLLVCGATSMLCAMPRTRFTMPSSTSSIGCSARTAGHWSSTTPPPPGGAPRESTLSSKAASSPTACFRSGSVTVRQVSTLGSTPSLVSPLSVMDSGFLPNSDSKTSGSRKYPMPRLVPQSCSTRAPLITIPGLYLSRVPVSLISTAQPSVTFSIRRSSEASYSRSPGCSSPARMSSSRSGRPDTVASTSRARKLAAPWNLSIAGCCPLAQAALSWHLVVDGKLGASSPPVA